MEKAKSVNVEIFQISISQVERLSFGADLVLKMTWREEELDRVIITKEMSFEGYWNPEITISNAIGDLSIESHIEADVDAYSHTYLIEKKNFRGLFRTTLSMITYPFDVHQLHFVVYSKLEDDVVKMTFSDIAHIGGGSASFVIQGGLILNTLYTTRPIKKDSEFIFYREEKQQLQMTVLIKRTLINFLGRYASLFFLHLVSLITLSMDPEMYMYDRSRIALGFFLLNVMNCRPRRSEHKLPILTYQNLYFLLMLYNNAALTLYHSSVAYLASLATKRRDAVHTADTFYLTQSLVLNVFLHFLFFFKAIKDMTKQWYFAETAISGVQKSYYF